MPRIPNNIIPYKMDFSLILNKPIFVGRYDWTTSQNFGALIAGLSVPGFMLTNNTLFGLPFQAATYWRSKMKFMFQVTGTPFYQGCLCAMIQPFDTTSLAYPSAREQVNKFMNTPHTFLFPNNATPACLEVPQFHSAHLVTTDRSAPVMAFTEYDYAELNIWVMNKLIAATSSTSTISLTIHVVFEDLEFYVPKFSFVAQGILSGVSTILDTTANVAKTMTGDAIDNVRGYIKARTGLHNPIENKIEQSMLPIVRASHNDVTSKTYSEKLDPYTDHDRVVDDAIFGTLQDEMNVLNILQTPGYIGTFDVTSSSTTGSVLWSRPITPFQFVPITNIGSYAPPTIELFAKRATYWRGGLKVYIQSVMTPFHICRLQVVKYYRPTKSALTTTPVMSQTSNSLVSTMEFSSGGQVQEIDLPYLSCLDVLPTSSDWNANALQHGIYYIFLQSPLVSSMTVSTTVQFNVYIKPELDFSLYGYPLYSEYILNATPTFRIRDGKDFGSVLSKRQIMPILKKDIDFIDEKIELYSKKVSTFPQDRNLKVVMEAYKEIATKFLDIEIKAKSLGDDQFIQYPKRSFSRDVPFTAQSAIVPINLPNSDPIEKDSDNVVPIDKGITTLRPMLDIREQIRRFTLAAILSWGTNSVSPVPTYFADVPISALLQMSSDIISTLPSATSSHTLKQSNLSHFVRYYHGFSGGIKLKIVVDSTSAPVISYYPPAMGYGVTDAAMISAEAVGPFSSGPLTAASLDPFNAESSATTAVLCPQLEVPNRIGVSNIGANSTLFKIYEFYIPDYNPFKFRTRYYDPTATTIQYIDTSFGHLYFHFSPSVTAANVRIYIAAADDFRMGMLVYNPVVKPLIATDGAYLYKVSASNCLTDFVTLLPANTSPYTGNSTT
jgi:hypothetical protein